MDSIDINSTNYPNITQELITKQVHKQRLRFLNISYGFQKG